MADCKPICSVPGCGNGYRVKKGLCSAHYQRKARYGDPLGGQSRIPRFGPCGVSGCKKPVYGLGYCLSHNRRFTKYGDPLAGGTFVSETGLCTLAGCAEPHFSSGFCRNHHHRWKKHGGPEAGPTADGEPLRWLQAHVNWTGDDCLTWPYARRSGDYGRLKLGHAQEYAHRTMCIMAHGSPPTEAHEAAHSCGNGHLACVNPKHLRWANKAENAADRTIHGTENIGERNGQAKLTTAQVREIRALEGSEPQRVTAARFSISRQTVSDIRIGRRWPSVA